MKLKMKQTKNKENKTWHGLWGDFLMLFSILKEDIYIYIYNLIKFTSKNMFNFKSSASLLMGYLI